MHKLHQDVTMFVISKFLFHKIRQVLGTNNIAISIQAKLQKTLKGLAESKIIYIYIYIYIERERERERAYTSTCTRNYSSLKHVQETLSKSIYLLNHY